MVKRILLSIVMLVLIAYLAVAITAFIRIRRLHHQRRAERYPSAQRDLPHRKEDGAHLYQVTGTGTKQTSVD